MDGLYQYLTMGKLFKEFIMTHNYVELVINYMLMEIHMLEILNKEIKVVLELFIGLVLEKCILGIG
jgi:hypothetical protein